MLGLLEESSALQGTWILFSHSYVAFKGYDFIIIRGKVLCSMNYISQDILNDIPVLWNHNFPGKRVTIVALQKF
jgi:hypothetical protein